MSRRGRVGPGDIGVLRRTRRRRMRNVLGRDVTPEADQAAKLSYVQLVAEVVQTIMTVGLGCYSSIWYAVCLVFGCCGCCCCFSAMVSSMMGIAGSAVPACCHKDAQGMLFMSSSHSVTLFFRLVLVTLLIPITNWFRNWDCTDHTDDAKMSSYSYSAVGNSTATYSDIEDYWNQRCQATMDYVKLAIQLLDLMLVVVYVMVGFSCLAVHFGTRGLKAEQQRQNPQPVPRNGVRATPVAANAVPRDAVVVTIPAFQNTADVIVAQPQSLNTYAAASFSSDGDDLEAGGDLPCATAVEMQPQATAVVRVNTTTTVVLR